MNRLISPSIYSVLHQLRSRGEWLPADCGGDGSCGRCGVQIVEGHLPVTDADRLFYSQNKLEAGFRLACQAIPSTSVVVQIQEQPVAGIQEQKDAGTEKIRFVIAVDIGTTTLALQLVNEETGIPVRTALRLNPQRAFGADVITRIQKAMEGSFEIMHRILREELLNAIRELVTGIHENQVMGVSVACNTTMRYFLEKRLPDSLGRHPYSVEDVGTKYLPFSTVFEDSFLSCPIKLLPCLDAFIGSDVVAGLLHLNFLQKQKETLFLDMGTNGELVVGNKHRTVAASAAAGPAFEGGGLSCGMGGIPGAIDAVWLERGALQVTTVEQLPPIGICGSGVVDAVALGRNQGWILEDGRLAERITGNALEIWSSVGGTPIVLDQQDIRKIQMAKSAIRAAVECLLQAANIRAEEVEEVILAGGFGTHLRPRSLATLGLLPGELAKKSRFAGNTALAGAADAWIRNDADICMEQFLRQTTTLSVAEFPDFQSLFMTHLAFSLE